MTDSMRSAAAIATRMAQTAPEEVKSPESHVIPLRYAYGKAERRAHQNAAQARGLYDVSANSEHWFVLARSPKRALAMVSAEIAYLQRAYSERTIKRICGVSAGTKERIL